LHFISSNQPPSVSLMR